MGRTISFETLASETDVKPKRISELRNYLLISMAKRSILVVEDIDCTIELQDRLARARAVNPRPHFHHAFNQGEQVNLIALLLFLLFFPLCPLSLLMIYSMIHGSYAYNTPHDHVNDFVYRY